MLPFPCCAKGGVRWVGKRPRCRTNNGPHGAVEFKSRTKYFLGAVPIQQEGAAATFTHRASRLRHRRCHHGAGFTIAGAEPPAPPSTGTPQTLARAGPAVSARLVPEGSAPDRRQPPCSVISLATARRSPLHDVSRRAARVTPGLLELLERETIRARLARPAYQQVLCSVASRASLRQRDERQFVARVRASRNCAPSSAFSLAATAPHPSDTASSFLQRRRTSARSRSTPAPHHPARCWSRAPPPASAAPRAASAPSFCSLRPMGPEKSRTRVLSRPPAQLGVHTPPLSLLGTVRPVSPEWTSPDSRRPLRQSATGFALTQRPRCLR